MFTAKKNHNNKVSDDLKITAQFLYLNTVLTVITLV